MLAGMCEAVLRTQLRLQNQTAEAALTVDNALFAQEIPTREMLEAIDAARRAVGAARVHFALAGAGLFPATYARAFPELKVTASDTRPPQTAMATRFEVSTEPDKIRRKARTKSLLVAVWPTAADAERLLGLLEGGGWRGLAVVGPRMGSRPDTLDPRMFTMLLENHLGMASRQRIEPPSVSADDFGDPALERAARAILGVDGPVRQSALELFASSNTLEVIDPPSWHAWVKHGAAMESLRLAGGLVRHGAGAVTRPGELDRLTAQLADRACPARPALRAAMARCALDLFGVCKVARGLEMLTVDQAADAGLLPFKFRLVTPKFTDRAELLRDYLEVFAAKSCGDWPQLCGECMAAIQPGGDRCCVTPPPPTPPPPG